MLIPDLYYYISGILFLVLIYAGYQDFKNRRINTVPFLVLDVALGVYYLLSAPYISIFVVPLILEYYLKKFSPLPYLLALIPPIIDPTVISVSIAYSIIVIKMIGIFVKNFGRGDIKALETIAIAVPFYSFLPLRYALFPPVMTVMFVSSIIGLILSIIMNSRAKNIHTGEEIKAQERDRSQKFWVYGERYIYKIPFVGLVAISFSSLFILSLLLSV